MALKLIEPPQPVVTWEEAKLHLRLDSDDEQSLVEGLIAAATNWIDGRNGWLGRAIGTQTWDLVYDAFPSGAIEVPFPPLQSVTGVFYADGEGVEQPVDTDDYFVDNDSVPGWVVPSSSWPTSMSTANAVRVRFVAGYTEVPAAIKAAILLIVGHLHDNRGDAGGELPKSAEMLLSPYKIWRI